MIKAVAGAIALWLSVSVAQAAGLQSFAVDLLGWSRATPAEIGCQLEQRYGYRDATFNCDLKVYVNNGDPCRDTTAYYEGPAFPDRLAARVHPLAQQVKLSFEHGRLRKIQIVLAGAFTEPQVRQALGLREDGKLPDTVQSLDVDTQTDDGRQQTVVSVYGFDHVGAGDVACPLKDVLASQPNAPRNVLTEAAHGLRQADIDIEDATLDGSNPEGARCAREPAFAQRVKAQVMLQVAGAYLFDVGNAFAEHRAIPQTPEPFADNKRATVGLDDMLAMPKPLAHLGGVVAMHTALMVRYRALALAGIDDLLRFETLEPLLTPADRTSLSDSYWNAPLAAFHADPKVQAALGDLAACYAQSLQIGKLRIADRNTNRLLSPLANYELLFWMRRRAESNTDLVHRALTMARETLMTAEPTAPPTGR